MNPFVPLEEYLVTDHVKQYSSRQLYDPITIIPDIFQAGHYGALEDFPVQIDPAYAGVIPPDIIGGIAIEDMSEYRNYQPWFVNYSGGNIVVTATNTGSTPQYTLPVVGATYEGLAFDTTMRVALCWVAGDNAYVYYWDMVEGEYTTLEVLGANSCKIASDTSARYYDDDTPDIVFTYTRAGNLYFRHQVHGYLIEYLVGATIHKLDRFGMTLGQDLQFECR
jgi:hypothetical protein